MTLLQGLHHDIVARHCWIIDVNHKEEPRNEKRSGPVYVPVWHAVLFIGVLISGRFH